MPVKIAYWVSTALFCAFYLFSVVTYVGDVAGSAALYESLGYPGYLVQVMIVVKAAGVLAVLVRRPVGLAQLAYAGFFYHLLLAFGAHIGAGDPNFAPALVLLVLVIVSWLSQNGARTPKAAYVPAWLDRWA